MGFSRQEYWNGLPFPSPGNLPNPGIQPTSPALAGRFFTTEPLRKPTDYLTYLFSFEKTLMLGGIGGQEEKGTTEDEMAGWHHQLDGREFE